MLQCHRSLKYLLLVPLLVALFVVGFMVGHFSADVPNDSNSHVVVARAKRDASSRSRSVDQDFQSQGGAVYTRWGRTVCPTDAEVVYQGVAGGSYFDHYGGGSNPLCLPVDPLWGTYNEAVEKGGKIYGAEYEHPSAFDFSNAGGRTTHDHDVPCVVCRSQTKTSVLMIPARNLCYAGWTAEYSGYLMSGHHVHKGRGEFICMDGSPEADPSGYRDDNGLVFYNVEGVCGSLPCPPYVPRREFTCVVCTKGNIATPKVPSGIQPS